MQSWEEDGLDEFPVFLVGKRGFQEEETAEVEHAESMPSKFYCEEYLDDDEEVNSDDSFICGVDGCEESFTSELVYQAHYEANHMHVCSVCGNTFYTFHLLNLHVLEYHDTMFKELNKQKPMYECVIRSCQSRFSSAEERTSHLIRDHSISENSSLHTAVEGKKQERDNCSEDDVC